MEKTVIVRNHPKLDWPAAVQQWIDCWPAIVAGPRKTLSIPRMCVILFCRSRHPVAKLAFHVPVTVAVRACVLDEEDEQGWARVPPERSAWEQASRPVLVLSEPRSAREAFDRLQAVRLSVQSARLLSAELPE